MHNYLQDQDDSKKLEPIRSHSGYYHEQQYKIS